jgi:outer membrane receptor protein involved in Fe transport
MDAMSPSRDGDPRHFIHAAVMAGRARIPYRRPVDSAIARGAVFTILSACLAATPANAQTRSPDPESDYDFFQFMKTEAAVASTRPETLLKTVSTVSIIDRKMIEAYNFMTVSEAVSVVAGFYMTRTTFMNTVPAGRILPGNYANTVLIMINGVPSWLATTGEGFLDRVSINDVERIEVLKGPASVLYGSNAFSGAINIVLRQSKCGQESVRLHGELAVPKATQAGGNYCASGDKGSLFLAANASAEEGRDTPFTDETGVSQNVPDLRYPKGGNFTLAYSYGIHSVLFNSYQDEFLHFEGATPEFAQGAGKLQRRDGYLANYTLAAPLTDALKLTYSGTYDWNGREFPRNSDESLTTRTSGYRVYNLAKLDASLPSDLDLELGVDHDIRWVDYYRTIDAFSGAVTDDANLRGRGVVEYSGFAQLGFERDRWKGEAGSRVTHNEFFGTNVASRGTLIYLLNDDNSLKLITGQSYRSPTPFELYFINPEHTVAGNPGLRPERSNSAELAYVAQRSDASLQAVAYVAQYKDIITRRTENVLFEDGVFAQGVRKYENGDNFTTRGLELEARYRRPESIDAFAAVTYVDSPNDGGSDFGFLPRVAAAVGAAQTLGPATLSGVVHYRGTTSGRLQGVSSYTTGDLSVAYQRPASRIRHVLMIKNVANQLTYFPEYVRQTGPFLNAVPSNDYRSIVYSAQLRF